jgi:hypothetical protein
VPDVGANRARHYSPTEGSPRLTYNALLVGPAKRTFSGRITMNTSRVVGQTGLVLLSKHRKLYGLLTAPLCEAGSQVATDAVWAEMCETEWMSRTK